MFYDEDNSKETEGACMMKKQLKSNRLYMALFVILFLLCYLFPYTGDDWVWGSQIGINRLNTWFENYSGRYFGNLIVLALTRSNLLKAFAMSLCIGGIIVMIYEITGKQKCGLTFTILPLVFMPVALLVQAATWTSGFANYTTSVFLTLIYIYLIRNIYTEKPANSCFIALITLMLGFGNTLIVEHLTIYNIILSIYVIIFTIIKYKGIFIQHISYCVGCVAGTAMMFSNGCYRNVVQGTDQYRTIGTNSGIISRALDNFTNHIVYDGFLNNFVLLCLLMIVCLIIWFEYKPNLPGKQKLIGYIAIFINIGYTTLSIMNQINTYDLKTGILITLESLATIAYVLSLIAFVLIIPFHIMEKVKLMFILLSAGCIMGPLLLVTPLSPRCFFASYVMFIYFIMELFSTLNETHKKYFETLRNALSVAVIAGGLYLFYIYGTIAVNSHERLEKALSDVQKGKTAIKIQELPYKDYTYLSDVNDGEWGSPWFKLYYGIDNNVSIEMVPHK